MPTARYLDPNNQTVEVTIADKEIFGTLQGPCTFQPGMVEGNAEYDALMQLVNTGELEITAFIPAPIPIPDNPTLSDWRVALTIWKRPSGNWCIDDVSKNINALVSSGNPMGRIAKERFEYANNVLLAQLMQLRGVLGFTESEVEESLWRADRVHQGDLSGVWPVNQ